MTNPDWTDRTLPVTERQQQAHKELCAMIQNLRQYNKVPTIGELKAYRQLLEDCAVWIANGAAELTRNGKYAGWSVDKIVIDVQKYAIGPNPDGEPWFPRD